MGRRFTILIEKNERNGYGYQVRQEPGGQVIDYRPYNLYQAVRMAGKMLEVMNRKTGGEYTLEEALHLDAEAIMENDRMDVASKYLSKKIEIRSFASGCTLPSVDKKLMSMELDEMSPAEEVVYSYRLWRECGVPEAGKDVERFCKFITLKGCHGGWRKILNELIKLPVSLGVEWIRTRFAVFVNDGEEMLDFIEYG